MAHVSHHGLGEHKPFRHRRSQKEVHLTWDQWQAHQAKREADSKAGRYEKKITALRYSGAALKRISPDPSRCAVCDGWRYVTIPKHVLTGSTRTVPCPACKE